MYNITKSLTCNGTNNLLTLLTGYNGPAVIQGGATLYNADAAVEAYLHLTDSSVNVPGTKQVETLACAGTVTVAGNGKVVVTGATLTGSPVTVTFAVTVGMTANDIRQAAINALSTNAVVGAFFTFTHNQKASLIATVTTVAANDGTLDLTISNDTSTGVSTVSSSNTTAGALATTSGMSFGPASPSTVMGLDKGTDLSTIWIHTASSIAIKCEVRG